MSDTSGFYKFQKGSQEQNITDSMLYAKTTVLLSDRYLTTDKKDTYQYPVDGWMWFKSEEDAQIMFRMKTLPNE